MKPEEREFFTLKCGMCGNETHWYGDFKVQLRLEGDSFFRVQCNGCRQGFFEFRVPYGASWIEREFGSDIPGAYPIKIEKDKIVKGLEEERKQLMENSDAG
jgi:ribosomal protein S27E